MGSSDAAARWAAAALVLAAPLALAAIASWFTSPPSSNPSSKRRKGWYLFVGGYTFAKQADPFLDVGGIQHDESKTAKGVTVLWLDSLTGALEVVDTSPAGPNPSFLALHPTLPVLYAVHEIEEFADFGRTDQTANSGGVSAFAIEETASGRVVLKHMNSLPSDGGSPCHVVVDRSGACLLVSNYSGGNVKMVPLQSDGSLSSSITAVDQLQGSGPDSSRQTVPHAHSTLLDHSQETAVVVDLGSDRVVCYAFRASTFTLSRTSEARLSPGTGPRQAVLHPTGRFIYVLGELTTKLHIFEFQRQDSTSGSTTVEGASTGALGKLISSQDTLPADWRDSSKMKDIQIFNGGRWAADLAFHPSGRFLFVSNRLHDLITCFKVNDVSGTLSVVGYFPSGGQTPRAMQCTPDGRHLLVAHQHSHSLVVFATDHTTGALRITSQAEVPLASTVAVWR